MRHPQRRAGIVWVAAIAASNAAAQAVVEVHLPPVLAEEFVAVLRVQLGADVTVRAGTGLAGAGAVVLATEVGLQLLAAAQGFERLDAEARASEIAVEPGGRWALPWAMHYGWLANASAAVQGRSFSFEALALDGSLQDRFALCAPTVDPVPWLLAMHECLLEGRSEAAGFGLWTALDARVGAYRPDVGAALAAVAAGKAEVGAVPSPLLLLRGLPADCVERPLGRSPSIRLGLAITAPGGAAAQAVAARLLEVGARTHLAQDLGLTPPTGIEPAFQAADMSRWLTHFEQRIRGQGRGVEQLADGLDYAFSFLFVVVVLAVWWHQRRRPSRTPQP